MLGMLVGTIAAPMTQLVGVMNQKLLSLVYVLKAVEEKKSRRAVESAERRMAGQERQAMAEAAEADGRADGSSEQTKPVVEGKMAEFVDWIEGISVLELSQLVKALEDRLGVSAAAPMAMAAAPAAGGGEAAAAEEQTEFDGGADGGRRAEDRGHQGSARDHGPGAEGIQGPGRRRARSRSRKA